MLLRNNSNVKPLPSYTDEPKERLISDNSVRYLSTEREHACDFDFSQ